MVCVRRAGLLGLMAGLIPLFSQEQPAAAGGQTNQNPQSQKSVIEMATRIQKEILRLPNYGVFDDLSFGIRNYEVTLKGYASRPTLKSSAENVTKKVEGVEKVINNIEVLPLSNVDDGIRARVYAAIYFNPVLSRYNPNRGSPIWMSPARIATGITNDPPPGFHPIHIIVKNGNVTLTGVVANVGDKNIAGIQANSVSGVFSVDNQLHVESEAKPKKESKSKKEKE
jgi:hyperosmotically inducible periplasmic protein